MHRTSLIPSLLSMILLVSVLQQCQGKPKSEWKEIPRKKPQGNPSRECTLVSDKLRGSLVLLADRLLSAELSRIDLPQPDSQFTFHLSNEVIDILCQGQEKGKPVDIDAWDGAVDELADYMLAELSAKEIESSVTQNRMKRETTGNEAENIPDAKTIAIEVGKRGHIKNVFSDFVRVFDNFFTDAVSEVRSLVSNSDTAKGVVTRITDFVDDNITGRDIALKIESNEPGKPSTRGADHLPDVGKTMVATRRGIITAKGDCLCTA